MKKEQLQVLDITIDVVRKNIKNTHIAVYPPDGRVRIAVPEHIDNEAVRLMVVDKLSWIRKQQRRFQDQERQTAREYVTGESHYVSGQRYRLDVVFKDEPPTVTFGSDNWLRLQVRPSSDVNKRSAVLTEWYRARLKEEIPPLIAKWESRIGVEIAAWQVRQMKTKWGSCNIERQRILLNLELAKKQPSCLEYIIVHELVHLLERHHNARFLEFMDRFLPNWRTTRNILNRAPLAYEDWAY